MRHILIIACIVLGVGCDESSKVELADITSKRMDMLNKAMSAELNGRSDSFDIYMDSSHYWKAYWDGYIHSQDKSLLSTQP